MFQFLNIFLWCKVAEFYLKGRILSPFSGIALGKYVNRPDVSLTWVFSVEEQGATGWNVAPCSESREGVLMPFGQRTGGAQIFSKQTEYRQQPET